MKIENCIMCNGIHKFENCKLVKIALKNGLGAIACSGSKSIFKKDDKNE